MKEKQQREASEHAADGTPDSKHYCQSSAHSVMKIDNDPLPNITPKDHYQISDSTRSFECILKFLSENAGDPVLHVSYLSLVSISLSYAEDMIELYAFTQRPSPGMTSGYQGQ